MAAGRTGNNTMQGAVYEVLKNGIMTLRLAPGTVMSTQEMATRLNVSRTPVRESFLRLQEEGLVDVIPQRETMVSRISLKRVDQERFIRESLEVAVVEPFLARCRPEDFDRLRALVRRQWAVCSEAHCAEMVDLDDEMHRYFFTVAGQELAWETVMNVTSHYRRIRVLTVRTEQTMRGTVEQHEVLVRLMEQKRADDVRNELMAHMRKIEVEREQLVRDYPDYFTTAAPRPGALTLGAL